MYYNSVGRRKRIDLHTSKIKLSKSNIFFVSLWAKADNRHTSKK